MAQQHDAKDAAAKAAEAKALEVVSVEFTGGPEGKDIHTHHSPTGPVEYKKGDKAQVVRHVAESLERMGAAKII